MKLGQLSHRRAARARKTNSQTLRSSLFAGACLFSLSLSGAASAQALARTCDLPDPPSHVILDYAAIVGRCGEVARTGDAWASWYVAQAKLNIAITSVLPQDQYAARIVGGDSWLYYSTSLLRVVGVERLLTEHDHDALRPYLDDAERAYRLALSRTWDAYTEELLHQDLAYLLLLARRDEEARQELDRSLQLQPTQDRLGYEDYERLSARCYVRAVLLRDPLGRQDCDLAGRSGGINLYIGAHTQVLAMIAER